MEAWRDREATTEKQGVRDQRDSTTRSIQVKARPPLSATHVGLQQFFSLPAQDTPSEMYLASA